jgi:cytochrome c-type biogenesis protein CcmH
MPATPLFWVIALLLVVAAVGALSWPLLRSRPSRAPEPDDAASTDVYRDQKRQLDDELAAGAITRPEYDANLQELTARLGAELGVPGTVVAAGPSRTPLVAALVLVAVLPVSALILYGTLGSPDAMRSPTAQTSERAPMSHEQIADMVDKLAARMKEMPDDPTGWKLLARAYSAMGRYQDSVAAFAEASARSPQDDPAMLTDWADALAMQKQTLQGEPSQLVARALALDPRNPKALSLSASAALERKDYDAAIAEWRKLQAQFAPQSEEAKEVAAMIADAEAARRGGPALAANAATAPPTPAEATAMPKPAARATAATPSVGVDPSAIRVQVSLDPKLRDRVAANDALFVFARAVNGPRMPLAVIRTKASELPHSFTLDDSMAMTSASKLSTAGDVVVEARVSRSGSATPSPGDLRGASGQIRPGGDEVAIVIDGILP